MTNWRREKINPLDVMNHYYPGCDTRHITFDPYVEKQYDIVRQGGCDGTMLLVMEVFYDAVRPLLTKETFYKPDTPDNWEGKDIIYTVGWLKHCTVYGKIPLKCGGIYPGQIDRIRIPVKSKIIERVL